MDVVGLAAILEAIEAAAQDATFALAVGLEDLVVEVGDELADGGGLLCVDVFAPEDGVAFCLAAAHAIEPVLPLTLDLPQHILFVDLQRAVDDGFGDNVYRLEDRMRLVAAPVKDRVKVHALLNIAQVLLQIHIQHLFTDALAQQFRTNALIDTQVLLDAP